MTLIYAHRGASASHPENTLLAFRAAVAAGVDGIEFDLRATADGVPVVIHDRGVARTTNGNGDVAAMSLATMQSLAAGEGEGERVPALAEVLSLVGDAVHLDIEIKDPTAGPLALDVLRSFPRARYAISSFNWDTLRALRRRDARVALWPLAKEMSEALLTIAGELGSPLVALAAAAYTSQSAGELRKAGFGAMIWTVNDVNEALRIQSLGAHALCTDDPVRILAALRGAA